MCRPQCQRAFVVAVGHGTDRRFGNFDNGGQDHNAQQNARSEHTFSHAENALHDRHNDHQSEESVHNGRDSRQQRNRRLQDLIQLLRAESRHKDGTQQPDGHPHQNSDTGGVNAADNHGENAELAFLRLPDHAGQEFQRSDLCNGGETVDEQESADQHHRQNGHAGCHQKDHFHNGLTILFHECFCSSLREWNDK